MTERVKRMFRTYWSWVRETWTEGKQDEWRGYQP